MINGLYFYQEIKRSCKSLPEDFLMIHQSFIVNKEDVFRYSYETVELTDGTSLAISSGKRKQVREKLLREE